MPPPPSSSSTTSGGLTSSGAVAGSTHARLRPPRGREALRSLAAEVDAWLAADDDDWPFSFVNVCHALRLDASSVRARVDRWRREAFGRATPPPSYGCDRRGVAS